MSPSRRGHTKSTRLTLKDSVRRVERYEQIVAAATTLTTLGNVDCQIRSVATASGVSPSTVYRYFTSKDDLLLACMHRWLRNFSATAAEANTGESDSYQRVLEVARTLTASLCSSPRFTDAVIRPYLYAHGAASALADIVRQQLIQIFYAAMSDGQPSQLHRSVAEVFTDIWVTNIAAISQHRTTIDDLMYRLTLVINALKQMNGHGGCTGASQAATKDPEEEDVA
jgi:AcrR family transcriptional regulator